MKKRLILVSALILVAVLFSSCDKIKTCVCTVKINDIVYEGYDKLPVGELKEEDCTAYKDDTWDELGYSYECISLDK